MPPREQSFASSRRVSVARRWRTPIAGPSVRILCAPGPASAARSTPVTNGMRSQRSGKRLARASGGWPNSISVRLRSSLPATSESLQRRHASLRHFDDAMKASILALYRSAVHVGAEWSPALANVAAPALVMWGIEDALLPHRFADSLGEATHARAVVKLRTAHWPSLEQPADVARELEAHWT